MIFITVYPLFLLLKHQFQSCTELQGTITITTEQIFLKLKFHQQQTIQEGHTTMVFCFTSTLFQVHNMKDKSALLFLIIVLTESSFEQETECKSKQVEEQIYTVQQLPFCKLSPIRIHKNTITTAIR